MGRGNRKNTIIQLLMIHALGVAECGPLVCKAIAEEVYAPYIAALLWLVFLSVSGMLNRKLLFVPGGDHWAGAVEFRPGAARNYCLLYGPQVLFSLFVLWVSIKQGYLWGLCISAVKTALAAATAKMVFAVDN